ncbi:bifunctional glutamate N-acetyltransferase/amino-acid acetyltransferase ArgJ [Berryella wangjianweii]|uniref:Arginine biosynthesis bifunctional protein ArgJ n=1 Tax=Berryella wangjianweii TaxID=2734634 RepID=A0A6M8J150_9ACTN|nr:bifunctional glutamate N-acetyltransferase/amino-acid acetyltransferase ArgJ [Berryella wangjianweii]NPD31678.1 bifunctional glutamate N-acetyltransferase/amino-acid acetyltransferase ArgJ [Eggerthellaceae bacterium zg-997]QKF07710.1 bifunctional glutamate N-acetyltransferase/amino-acid acetyltransferase ArgJ [Berryella wangjianweii]
MNAAPHTPSLPVEPLGLSLETELRSGLTPLENGGVTSARGFVAAGVHAGFKKDPSALDLALVASEHPCACAAVFTQNTFCAAPVEVSRQRLDDVGYGTVRAVMVNAGVANAATGPEGVERARASAALLADHLGCPEDEVLVASTGVIGRHMPLEPFRRLVPQLVAQATPQGGAQASSAIVTTDTHPKQVAVAFDGAPLGHPGVTFTVGGMAKGSGMIMPNMATMIAVITTDAPVAAPHLHSALSRAVGLSFNRVTVDSDTSTNDSCFVLASGAAAPHARPLTEESPGFELFESALVWVCSWLARAIAADGEGATKLVTVQVAGAASVADADAAARTIANSPLVKTALYGHDANWGRIAAALGRSGARFSQSSVSIDIMGLPVCRRGLAVAFDEEEALRRFERPDITVDVYLGAGSSSAFMWTCDLSHDYVTINGDYRS